MVVTNSNTNISNANINDSSNIANHYANYIQYRRPSKR